MSNRTITRLFASLTLLCLFATMAMAQVLAGGSIQGTVTDSTGAVIADAAVTARNTATNLTYEATSDRSGFFAMPIVKVGNYEIKASKAGFGATKIESVTVSVGSKLTIPVALKVATSKEEVNVTAEAPLVETDRTAVASNVNQKSIENLPVNGRNFMDFVLLTPSVVKDPNRGGDLSFAGMRGTSNSLTVDGNDDNNTFYGQTASRTGFKAPYQFSQDAVQEFQVATNGYSAEIGRAGGAVVNAVTKSGTNKFHGDAFEYYRDQSLNAYDPMQKQNFYIQPANAGKTLTALKNKYHFNQFGGSLGGPVWKDKAFFFVNVDDQRNTVPNVVSPLPAIALISPNTAPTPEQTAAYNYLAARDGSWSKTNNQNAYLLKFDANLNSKNQLSARWNRQRFTAGNQESSGGTISLEHTGNSYIHTDNANVSLTSTLSPKIVNQARFAYLRDREPGVANSTKPEAVVKVSGATALQVGANYFSPRETTIGQEQYSDSVSWMTGHHTIKVGGDAVVIKIKNFFPGYYLGSYTFTSYEDFGCSLNGYAPGTTVNGATCATPTYQQAFAGANTSGATSHPDAFEPSFFAQDDIRLIKNLVVNIGVRYDYQGAKQSGVYNADVFSNFGLNTAKQTIQNNEWAPRFGFAYDALGNGKLVVRGGYGIFYATTNSMALGTTMTNNGYNSVTYSFTGATVPTYPATLSSLASSGTTGTPSIFVMGNNFRNPVIQQSNLGVEYQVNKDLSVSVSALHVKGDHLPMSLDVNLTTPTPITVLDTYGISHSFLRYSGRKTSKFGMVEAFSSVGSSNYNGLAFEVKKRYAHHLQANLSYTWSHAIDDNPDATSVTFGGSDFVKNPMYPTMPWLDRANAGADVRQRLTTGYVWDLNYGSLKGWKGAIANGWNTSGIVTIQSGLPYSAMIGSDLLNDGNSYNVRDTRFGRNSLRMPATWSFDPRVAREIKLPYEGVKINLFAEAFNLFNHFNITGVQTTEFSYTGGTLTPKNRITAPTTYFGLANNSTSTTAQRIVQLGAKVVF